MLENLATILGEPPPPVFESKRPRPLKIGTREDMLARYPHADQHEIAAWLSPWTRTSEYLKQLTRSKHRYDLDGMEVGEIRETERAYARFTLAMIVQTEVDKRSRTDTMRGSADDY